MSGLRRAKGKKARGGAEKDAGPVERGVAARARLEAYARVCEAALPPLCPPAFALSQPALDQLFAAAPLTASFPRCGPREKARRADNKGV